MKEHGFSGGNFRRIDYLSENQNPIYIFTFEPTNSIILRLHGTVTYNRIYSEDLRSHFTCLWFDLQRAYGLSPKVSSINFPPNFLFIVVSKVCIFTLLIIMWNIKVELLLVIFRCKYIAKLSLIYLACSYECQLYFNLYIYMNALRYLIFFFRYMN